MKQPREREASDEHSVHGGIGLGSAISALAGAGFVAYLAGWAYAQGYFRAMDAKWLVDEITPTQFLSFSFFPLSLPLMGAIVAASVLCLSFKESSKVRTAWIPIAFFTATVPAIVALLLPQVSSLSWSPLNLIVTVCLFVFGAGVISLSYVIARVFRHAGKPRQLTVSLGLVCVLAIHGLYFLPRALGRIDAMRDADGQLSTLPIVHVQMGGETNTTFHLLCPTTDRVFCIALRSNSTPHEVLVLDWSRVTSIEKQGLPD